MKTIANPIKAELNIKKSQFICRIFPIANSKEAKEIINEIVNKYSDATHNCTAYLCFDGEGYDDDGEPGGTAGRPILNVLKKNDLKNIVAIVTRYFGGVKLGAGGLVRAYSKSVIEAIEIANIIEMELYNIYKISFDYDNIKAIDSEIRLKKIHILNKKFEEKVIYKLAIDEKKEIKSFNNLNPKIETISLGKEYLKKV